MKKSFGQHFLKDKTIAKKIVAALDLSPNDFLIEVGPGAGILTEQVLLKYPELQMVLIEADKDLIADLRQKFSNIKIINKDAAKINYDELTVGKQWKFLSNLPYNAGNAILRQVYSGTNKPTKAVVMVQKEVADKILATPKTGNGGVLTVATQIYTNPKKILTVKPGSFVPPPAVMSTVISLDLHIKTENPEAVIDLAKVGFSARRKQLKNNLSAYFLDKNKDIKQVFEKAKIDFNARPQDLSIDDWVRLQNLL
ncbi:ribosomal RNA small subunit methyltransferase A [Candidatus Parcubacteria bacterium]|nr:MAG: ribosomal RNA small subunit methyltransferase A [Candidatus Parcubacteria bacterium]